MVSVPFRDARDYACGAARVYTMLAIFLIAFAGSDCRSFPQDYTSYGDHLILVQSTYYDILLILFKLHESSSTPRAASI